MGDEEEAILEAEAVEEMERQLPAVRESNALVTRGELTVEELVGQADKIRQVMAAAMKPGVHYGKIPGIDKPTLFKPGAELLNVLLRLAPSYTSDKTFHEGGHLTVVAKCTLTHIPTGFVIAEGEGLCSTYESRYAFRQGGRVCPNCGQPAIIKGKAEYGGGWLCFGKKGGCGTKWEDGSEQAQAFESEETGRVENPDIPDTWNTVLKMADKRALLAACLNGTAASDIFTQDAEDLPPAREAGGAPFDPGTDLLEGAIRGDDAPHRITEMLKFADPTVNWREVIQQVLLGTFGVDDRRKLGKRNAEFWRRLSNAARKMELSMEGGDFPPANPDLVRDAFAWAFTGTAIELSYVEVDTPEVVERAPLSKEQAEKIDEQLEEEDVEWPAPEDRYGYEREP